MMGAIAVYDVPKLPAILLAGICFVLLLTYIAAVWLGEDYIAELSSGFLAFSVLLLSAYIGFAGARNLSLGPFSCFLNGAFVSGASHILLLVGLSITVLIMGKSLYFEVVLLMPIAVMALIGGISGLLGWLAATIIGSASGLFRK